MIPAGGEVAISVPASSTATTRRAWWTASTTLALLSGLVTIVGSLLLPFAPVEVDEPTVSWPLVATAPTSTLLPLEAGSPLGLEVGFSCRAVVEASASEGDRVLLATTDPDRPDRAEGLRLVAGPGTLTAFVGTRQVLRDTVPPGPCQYRITTSDDGLTYTRDGLRLGTSPLPVVDALITGITALPGPDLTVTVRVDDRFATSPAPVKIALLALLAVSASVTVGYLLTVRKRPDGHGRRRRLMRFRPASTDAAVVGVLVVWLFLAPMTHDDGWMYAMAINQRYAGYFGNYYMYFNNSYVPFTWLLWIYSWWSRLGISPVLMRIPSLAFALVTWAAVRGTLGDLARGRRLLVPALLFLAWWLPFGLGTRQEASVAACLTVTGYAMTAAHRRQQPAYLGLAVAAASLGLIDHPAGAIGVLPLLLGGPAAARLVRRTSRTAVEAVATTVCVLCCATVAGFAGFADGSLKDFVRGGSSFGGTSAGSTAGPLVDEIDRYRLLLGDGSIGNYAIRTPVLLLLLVLPFFVMLCAHARRRQRPPPRVLWLTGWTCLLGLGVLVLTPSKWTWHFGAFAGIATVFLSAWALALPRLAVMLLGDRPSLARGAGALSLAATVGWVWLSGRGRNWWADNVMPGVPRAGEPLLAGTFSVIAAVAVAVVIAVGLWTWRARRSLAPVLTSGVLIGCFLTAELAFLVTGFGVAVVRTWDNWSPWADAVQDPLGHRCGEARVLWVADPDTAVGVTVWSGEPAVDGFARNRWWPDSPPEPGPATEQVWGSLPVTVGAPHRLRTPWLRLPAGLSVRNQLMTTVSGLTGAGNELTAEFAAPSTGSVGGLRVVGDSRLDDHEDDTSWRDASITSGSDLPVGAVAFRLTATVTRGWLAFAMPTVRRLLPVADALPSDGRTLVDWQLAWLYPCQGQPPIAHGIVAPVSYTVAFGFGPADSRFSVTNGGTWTAEIGGLLGSQVRTSTRTRMYTVYSPDPGYPMRTVYRLTRHYADHAYRLRMTTRTTVGW
ncbi:arabinosyltransferase domain-containing protein [Pseudonocardia spinosispora]|uniref:arabinosyltransferase domain-containing protein n=1 Tax=Pseudonocardia spinosispora TaxID=103441 RepID=UPI0003FC01AA|nr:arabinosyltransferase domain-containing protein [Pseudonocardia spinosispora]